MRFMMLVIPRGYERAPADALPSAEIVAAMTKYNDSLKKAGVLLSLDGLHPQASAVRVTFPGGKPKVTDGPFSESKEAVGGYWIIQVKSKAEAVEWAKRVPFGDDGMIEIRQITEVSEWPEELRKAAGVR